MIGWAGGEKYLYAGILFKFADSVPLPTELANKISAIEFNATQSIHQALDRTKDQQEQLSVPLTTILDYLGYRLEAVAFSPISDDTLVYGSCDAGKHVKRIDPVTDALMAEYGDRLNLCPHLVKQRCDGTNVEVFGAADVEVHLVRDEDANNANNENNEKKSGRRKSGTTTTSRGLRIVCDSSRLYPPLPPTFGAHKLLHLARRFRPELVQMFGRPLNGDVYTVFQATDDPDKESYYQGAFCVSSMNILFFIYFETTAFDHSLKVTFFFFSVFSTSYFFC